MLAAFTSLASAKLTSTTSSQTITIPPGYETLVAYNASGNVVYMAFSGSVSVPGGTFVYGVTAVQPSTTQSFGIPGTGGTLAYIADTAGGTLVLSLGDGI